MMNKKIFELIKKSGRAIMWRYGSEQWVSDGIGAYSLAGLPEFSVREFLCMCDIPEDAGFPVTETDKPLVTSDDAKQYEAKISPISISVRGKDYVMISYDSSESFFVQMKYIKDFLKNMGYLFSVRVSGDMRWLSVYDGHFLCACIMPSEIVTENLFGALYDVSAGADRQLKKSEINASGIRVRPEKNVLGRWQGVYQSLEHEQMEI